MDGFGDLTPQAQRVFEAVFPKLPWPDGWRVRWSASRSDRVFGLCSYRDKTIYLSHSMAIKHGRCVQTLLHEFVHMVRGPKFRHGQSFDDIEQSLLRRLFGFDHDKETMRGKRQRLRRMGGAPTRQVSLAAERVREEMELRPLADVLAGLKGKGR